MITKNCSSCRYYAERDYGYGSKPVMECDGPPVEYLEVSADDDQGLCVSFRPPAEFSCSSWEQIPDSNLKDQNKTQEEN